MAPLPCQEKGYCPHTSVSLDRVRAVFQHSLLRRGQLSETVLSNGFSFDQRITLWDGTRISTYSRGNVMFSMCLSHLGSHNFGVLLETSVILTTFHAFVSWKVLFVQADGYASPCTWSNDKQSVIFCDAPRMIDYPRI